MKPELQEKVYAWVTQTAQNIGEWTSKEVPLFITEYLQWKFWENMVGIIGYFTLLIIFIAIIISLRKWFMNVFIPALQGDKGWTIPITFIMAIVSIVSVIGFCAMNPYENIITCLKIKIAPKVYLLQEASRIIKN